MLKLWWVHSALALCCLGPPLCCFGAHPAHPFCADAALSGPAASPASATSDLLRGTVSDPSGAKIQHAEVHIQGGSEQTDTRTDSVGSFSLFLPPGEYDVTIAAHGFRSYSTTVMLSTPPAHVNLNVRLEIATEAEEITVPAEDVGEFADNKSALVFKGDQLKTFSDNDSTFQREIGALAGGEPGKPPEILVDGFANGRFPPKNTIREVRLNQNPYSAQYDSYGLGRVEILTQPGTDKLHGELDSQGNDNVFNARNPYTTVEPPYYTLNLNGNLSGSFSRRTSFFLSGVYNDVQNNAVVDAIDPTLLTPLMEAVPAPQKTQTYGGRIDRKMTLNNTFTGRYEFNRASLHNSGVGLLVLPSEGLDSTTTTQTLQLTDAQLIGSKIVSEAHFQYIRTRQEQAPASTAAAVVVEGAFNGGGNPAQRLSDNQDRYEVQELFLMERGSHFFHFGGRYRLERDANFSTNSYNGQFTFPSVAAYQLALSGQTPAQIFASTGETTQYNVTTGDPSATVLTGDLGVFAEDEWKVSPNVALDLGFRFESQSAVPDHVDPSQHVGFSWAIRNKKKKLIVRFRGGSAIFYDRFAAANILTAIRQQSGTLQPSYFVENPNFYQQYINTPPPLTLLGSIPPTLYNIDPHLRTEYGIYNGISAERRLWKIGTISANYSLTRGDHQYLSRNINAPLPGTYSPADPASGVRPLGGTQNIYQFASGGIFKSQTFYVNAQLQLGNRFAGYILYSVSRARQDVTDAAVFPSNSYDLAQDYGRSPQPSQSLFAAGTVQLPLSIETNFFVSTRGGAPFNITTGTDLNGDTIYNDRPAFATNPTANSIIYKTRFGTFDANPQPGEKIIPINYGNSPNLFFIQLSLDRSFKIGPRAQAPAPAPGAAASKTPAPKLDRPYNLTFTIDAANLLNHANPGPPVGVLSSPLFGQSISLNPTFSVGGTSANRTVTLSAKISF